MLGGASNCAVSSVTLHDLHEAGDDHQRGRLRHVLAVAQAARVDGVAGVEENAW